MFIAHAGDGIEQQKVQEMHCDGYPIRWIALNQLVGVLFVSRYSIAHFRFLALLTAQA